MNGEQHDRFLFMQSILRTIIDSGGCECPDEPVHAAHVREEAERLWEAAHHGKPGIYFVAGPNRCTCCLHCDVAT